MTDDGLWLENEIKLLQTIKSKVSHYQIGRLAAEYQARNEIKSNGSKMNGTKYSVDFWTSITLARQCQGFVGHFGSGLSKFVYDAMCFQHYKHTGECPFVGDVGLE